MSQGGGGCSEIMFLAGSISSFSAALDPVSVILGRLHHVVTEWHDDRTAVWDNKHLKGIENIINYWV